MRPPREADRLEIPSVLDTAEAQAYDAVYREATNTKAFDEFQDFLDETLVELCGLDPSDIETMYDVSNRFQVRFAERLLRDTPFTVVPRINHAAGLGAVNA